MAAAFIQNRSAWERVAIAAVVMAPTFYALWAKRVDIPRGREALEEARRLSKELAEYGAVVIPPHGLATDPDQMELARTKVRMNTRLHWSELRLALQRFWRAAADETIDIDDPTTWPDPDKLGGPPFVHAAGASGAAWHSVAHFSRQVDPRRRRSAARSGRLS